MDAKKNARIPKLCAHKATGQSVVVKHPWDSRKMIN